MAIVKGKAKKSSKTLWVFGLAFVSSLVQIGNAYVGGGFEISDPGVQTAVLSAIGFVLRFFTEEPLN